MPVTWVVLSIGCRYEFAHVTSYIPAGSDADKPLGHLCYALLEVLPVHLIYNISHLSNNMLQYQIFHFQLCSHGLRPAGWCDYVSRSPGYGGGEASRGSRPRCPLRHPPPSISIEDASS